MRPDDIVIRALDPPGIGVVVDWAAEEGWNPGLDDARHFHAADPGGFLGLFVEEELAASISAVIYDAAFAFIGFYICRRDLRGRGYGRHLWDAAIARLGNRTVGLDGVVAQQENYAAAGFAYAHRNVRYAGRPPAVVLRHPDLVETGSGAPAAIVERIVAYDRACFPAARGAFVRHWVAPTEGRRTLAFVAEGAVRGYGTIRPCRSGFKVGPLFADDARVAGAIFAGLIDTLGGAEIMLDVPEPNAPARRLAEGYGMAPSFETARMYRGTIPPLPLGRTFGITSFELG